MSAATSRLRGGHGSVWRRHRRAITAVFALLAAAAFAHYVLPHVVSLGPTLGRLRRGHIAWLALGVALEACSLFGEVALFRGVFARPGNRIKWSSSAEITFAGAAATKLVAAAGAAGVAVTVLGPSRLRCVRRRGGERRGLLRRSDLWRLRRRRGDRRVRPLVRVVQRSRPGWSDPGPRCPRVRRHRRRPVDAVRRPRGDGVSRATSRALERAPGEVVAPRRRGATLSSRRAAGRARHDQTAGSVASGGGGVLGV